MKFTPLMLASALIFATSAVFAQGVSSDAPGQQPKGTHESPGATYNAPGQEMHRNAKNPNPGLPALPATLRDIQRLVPVR